jgi:hypothetical protein
MNKRDYKGIFGGLIMLAFGLLLAIYPAYHYSFGTLVNMGPGLFPSAIGWVLTALSCGIIVIGLFTQGDGIQIGYRPLLVVSASVLIFALAISRVGLFPAVALAVIVSSFAEKRTGLIEPLVLAGVMVVFSAAVFHYGLNMNIPLLAWRW